jgi:hypothetical protein
MVKHSSLFVGSIGNEENRFSQILTWGKVIKLFYLQDLQFSLISQSICPWQTILAYSNVFE